MADRDLTINLKILKTAAEAASKQFHADEKKRIDKTLSDFEVAEKAKSAIVARENKQRIQEVVKGHKTAIDLAAERARAEKAGAQAINIALRQSAADEKRLKQEAAREDARLQRELVARHKANYRERQKEKKDQAAETKRLLKEESDAWSQNEGAILGGVKAVGAFALGMAGLNSASAIIGEFEAGFQRTRDAIYQSSNLLHEYREGLLELAALKDRSGDTSAEMLDTLRLQARTGQKTEDVKALQLQFLGTAESVVGPGKKVSEAEKTAAMEGVGKLAAVMGGGAGEWGRMGGMVAQVMKPGANGQLSGKSIAEETAAMYAISRPAQFPTIDAGAEQFSKVQGLVENGVLDLRTAMALVSNAGAVKPQSAGQDVNRLIRMAMSATTKDTMGRVMPMEGVEQESMAAWNKRLGINEKMGPVERLRLMAGDFDRAEAEATAKGQGFNPFAYGRTVGITGKGELDALTDFRASLKSGRFGVFEGLAGDANLGKGTIAGAEDKLRSEVTFQQRMSKAAEQTARMASGAGKNEMLTALRRTEYAKMRAVNPSMVDFDEMETRSTFSLGSLFDELKGVGTGDVRANLERTLMSQAKKRGIPFQMMEGSTLHMSEDEQFRVAKLLQSQGFDFAGEANQQVNSTLQGKLQDAGMVQAAADIKAAAKDMKAAAQAQAKAAEDAKAAKPQPLLPGKPQQRPAAPAAAGGNWP